ncbi:MAG: hypothetical protein AAB553_03345 [Patescibacteria group bacterium]
MKKQKKGTTPKVAVKKRKKVVGYVGESDFLIITGGGLLIFVFIFLFLAS